MATIRLTGTCGRRRGPQRSEDTQPPPTRPGGAERRLERVRKVLTDRHRRATGVWSSDSELRLSGGSRERAAVFEVRAGGLGCCFRDSAGEAFWHDVG